MHVHLGPLIDAAALAGLPGVTVDEDGRVLLAGRQLGPDALYEPQLLVEHLHRARLDAAAVSIPPPFFRQRLEADACARWVAACNDGLRRACAPHRQLVPLAYLPLEHPAVALAEHARTRDWAGHVASAGGSSASLADEALAPLWRRIDGLLMLHPGDSPDERLAPFYLANLLGNPVETTVAAAQLVFGGVLTSNPDMRVLLVHCGGCVPSVLGRWERGLETARPGVPLLAESPRRAVRRLYADCLAHDPGALDQALAAFGADRIVLGSDWPFPMGTDDPRALVAHLPAPVAGEIATANAARLLGLGG